MDDPLTGHHAPIDYHVALISDPWRVARWATAINALVRPGDRVLDAGAGIGLLSAFAARAGGHVIAVESAWVAGIARQVALDAGVADRVDVRATDLADARPETVDVILCDFIGRWLPDAAMRRAVLATAAWAGPTTRFAPARVRLLAAPVGDVPLPAIDRLRTPILGVSVAAALPAARSAAWGVQLGPEALVASPVTVGALAPPDLPEHVDADATFTLARATTLRGLALWFEAELAPDVLLDTAPGRQTFWGQTLLPAPDVAMQAGDRLEARIRATSLPGGVGFRWNLTGRRGDDVLFAHHGDTAARPIGEAPADPPRSAATLLAAGRPDLATVELIAAVDADPTRDALGDLVVALALRGDHGAATAALDAYERAWGPHPNARRNAGDPSAAPQGDPTGA
jgi:SAM-dependent methyltransferase